MLYWTTNSSIFLKKLSKNWFRFTTISIGSPAALLRSLEIGNSTNRLRLMILMQYWHFPHNATLPQSKRHLLLQIKILSELFIYSRSLLTPTTKCLLYDKGTINKYWFLSSRLTVWYNCFIQSHVNIHVCYVANFVARYMIDYIRGLQNLKIINDI